MTEVWLDDIGMTYDQAEQYFLNAEYWAREFCQSFVSCTVQDVSDYSIKFDLTALYLFHKDSDAMIFRLKWL